MLGTSFSVEYALVLMIPLFSCNAGVVDTTIAKQTLVGNRLERAKQDMEGRTGETDSEAEE